MHFSQATLLLLAATGALASPLNQEVDARDDLTLIKSENEGNGGSFEVWGRSPEDDDDLALLDSKTAPNGEHFETWGARSLDARGTKCASGSITPVCDDKNGGQNALCISLIGYLSSFGTQKVPDGTKQLCYSGPDGKCCTGWNTKIKDLEYRDLISNAQKMYQSCSGSSGNSGKMNGVKLYGTCTNQCLNNGHKCS